MSKRNNTNKNKGKRGNVMNKDRKGGWFKGIEIIFCHLFRVKTNLIYNHLIIEQ